MCLLIFRSLPEPFNLALGKLRPLKAQFICYLLSVVMLVIRHLLSLYCLDGINLWPEALTVY